MSVRCRQTVSGEAQEYVIEPHFEGQKDVDLLAAKAAGAMTKGWAVEWTAPSSFTATKSRWSGVECVRQFWIE